MQALNLCGTAAVCANFPARTHAPRLSRCALMLCILLMVTAAVARCQEADAQPDSPDVSDLKRLTLEELTQLEVTTVSKEPFRAFRTPAAIYVLTRDDIRRSGATSLPEVLRLVPGVHVAQIDSGKWALGIRGFQGRLSRAVRVLIDGRSVYTPLFAGVYWEVQHVLLEDIDRIEVVRGPGATVWGANAVNGVINIITRNARDTHGMLVSAASGNVEQGQFSWRYGGGTDRLSARIYGTGFTRGPQYHSDDRDFDDWRMGQIGFRADWAPTDRDSIRIQGDAYSTIAGQKLVISEYSPPAAPAVEDNGFYSGQNIVAGWHRKLVVGGDIQLNAFFDRTDRKDLNYREVRTAWDVDFIHQIPLRRNTIIWGAGTRISPGTYTQTRETVDFLPHDQTYNIFSGFFQDEIAILSDRLALTLGSKFEHNSFSGFEIQPSARVAWTPNRRHTVWGAVSRAVRTPSRIEEGFLFTALIQPAVPLYVRLIGDGQFSPEQMVGYEFGYRSQITRSALLSIATFHNRYDDLLSVENRPPAPESTPPPTRLVLPLYLRNGIEAMTSGVEIVGIWDVLKTCRLNGSYSFLALDAKRNLDSNDLSTMGQLEGDSPAHKLILSAALSLPRKFEADLTWWYISSLPDQRVPRYSTGDLRIGRRFGHQVEISFVGRNLLQPFHCEYGGNPGPLVGIRRSAYLKVTWTR